MALLQDMGHAWLALSRYDCKRAIELFEALPVHQFNTAWVLENVAIAYYEMLDYNTVSSTL